MSPENTEPPAGEAQGFCNDPVNEADENGAGVKRLAAQAAFVDGLPGPTVGPDWAALDSASAEWMERYSAVGMTQGLADEIARREGPPPAGDSDVISAADRRAIVAAVLFAVFREECTTLAAAARAFPRWLAFVWLTAPTIFRSASMHDLASVSNRDVSTVCRIVNELAAEFGLPVPDAKTDAHCAAMAIGRARAASQRKSD